MFIRSRYNQYDTPSTPEAILDQNSGYVRKSKNGVHFSSETQSSHREI